jgi:hypothetical protein
MAVPPMRLHSKHLGPELFGMHTLLETKAELFANAHTAGNQIFNLFISSVFFFSLNQISTRITSSFFFLYSNSLANCK